MPQHKDIVASGRKAAAGARLPPTQPAKATAVRRSLGEGGKAAATSYDEREKDHDWTSHPHCRGVAACRGASAFAQVETVALFNPSLLETPESIAIDHDNNKYVSLALTGEIRRSPATAASPPSPCCRSARRR